MQVDFRTYTVKRPTSLTELIYNIVGIDFSLEVRWVSRICYVFSIKTRENAETFELSQSCAYSQRLFREFERYAGVATCGPAMGMATIKTRPRGGATELGPPTNKKRAKARPERS